MPIPQVFFFFNNYCYLYLKLFREWMIQTSLEANQDAELLNESIQQCQSNYISASQYHRLW